MGACAGFRANDTPTEPQQQQWPGRSADLPVSQQPALTCSMQELQSEPPPDTVKQQSALRRGTPVSPKIFNLLSRAGLHPEGHTSPVRLSSSIHVDRQTRPPQIWCLKPAQPGWAASWGHTDLEELPLEVRAAHVDHRLHQEQAVGVPDAHAVPALDHRIDQGDLLHLCSRQGTGSARQKRGAHKARSFLAPVQQAKVQLHQ